MYEQFEMEVSQGLKPSTFNKSKELSQETVSLYTQILQSSEKNFQSLIGCGPVESFENGPDDHDPELKEIIQDQN
jgi:hypothetical protein